MMDDAPKVIWAVPPIGATFEEGLFMATTDASEARPRYIRADAPELLALVMAAKQMREAYMPFASDEFSASNALDAALAAYEALQ